MIFVKLPKNRKELSDKLEELRSDMPEKYFFLRADEWYLLLLALEVFSSSVIILSLVSIALINLLF